MSTPTVPRTPDNTDITHPTIEAAAHCGCRFQLYRSNKYVWIDLSEIAAIAHYQYHYKGTPRPHVGTECPVPMVRGICSGAVLAVKARTS